MTLSDANRIFLITPPLVNVACGGFFLLKPPLFAIIKTK
jgi:hypothetical protein